MHISPTSFHLQAAMKKKKTHTQKVFKGGGQFLERRQKNEPIAEKGEDRKTKGLEEITGEQIEKWNQMTSLRLQTGEDIRYPWPPFRVINSGRLSNHESICVTAARKPRRQRQKKKNETWKM